MREKTLEKILKKIIDSGINTREDLGLFKRKVAKKHGIPLFSNVELLKTYHNLVENKRIERSRRIERLLRKKPTRSLSGIVNVTVLTKPHPCPGECVFCPTREGVPKSYLRGEPAVERALRSKFDPYKQARGRIDSLNKIGHPIDKIELRIIGGTWSFYPSSYKKEFVKECFRACNDYPKKNTIKGKESLGKLQKENEEAKAKLIGITVETRPDYINIEEIKEMRRLGITRVELGVQSIYNDVLDLIQRGHHKEETIKATKLLKDTGFKVSYQIMPNLPGSSFERDVKMFEKIFSEPEFQPDLLKIYPLAIIKDTPLYNWYKEGKFKPYNKEELLDLLVEIKKKIPYYCRIERMMRDISAEHIVEGGVKKSNLREEVQKRLSQKGLSCKCIRCREIKKNYDPKEEPTIFREDYKASGGKEIFLSFEDKKRKKIYALIRLRIPGESQKIFPVLKKASIIREVHTYGQMVPVKETSKRVQHRGLGKRLIKKAEKITKEESGLNKVAIISGIGTRGYYREKLGYTLKDTYMVKRIS